MKKIILTLLLVCAVFLAGCTDEDWESDEDIAELASDIDNELGKLMSLITPVLEYEGDMQSKSLVNNLLGKISKFNTEVKGIEEDLETLSMQDDTEEFVSAYTDFINIVKKVAAKQKEMLDYDLDFMEQEVLQQNKDKTEELHNAIVNCRCREVDCDNYLESTTDFMDASITIFKQIRQKYALASFGKIVDAWEKEKQAIEKHMPDLIRQVNLHGTDRCYKINDDYSEYLKEFDSIEYVTEEEIADDISERWTIPILDLLTELDQVGIDVEDAFSDIMEG